MSLMTFAEVPNLRRVIQTPDTNLISPTSSVLQPGEH